MRLKRLTRNPYKPTFGVLFSDDGVPFALTLERPWLNNLPNQSCIPEGRYLAIRHVSPKFGETFWLQDVPGRSGILFHKGNNTTDSQGCILIGEQFNQVNGEPGITHSSAGFQEFMRLCEGKAEIIVVIEGSY